MKATEDAKNEKHTWPARCRGDFNVRRGDVRVSRREAGDAAIAVLADVGNLRDIHPNNKEIVAKRLALHALKNDYGFGKVRPNSPTLKSWKVENGAMVLSFNDARGWYVYEADRSVAPNFEIAGPDNKFVPAKLANVDGNGRVRGADLVVSAEEVKEPCRLRYLYKSPFTGTLYNDVCLPLGSFEVDARTNKPTRVGAPVRLGDAEQAKELEGYRKIQTLDIPVRPNYAQNPPPPCPAAGRAGHSLARHGVRALGRRR